MPRRNLFLPLAALVVTILFVFVLMRILMLRYERGDVYQPNSTLRADPLGTRAFYEALDATGLYQVERGLVSMHQEMGRKPATIFYLGLDTYDLQNFSEDEIAALDDYVRKGGRVVIALEAPRTYEKDDDSSKERTNTAPSKKNGHKKKKPSVKPAAAPVAKTPPAEPQTQEEQREREEFRKEQDAKSASEKQEEFSSEYERTLTALWGFGWNEYGSDTTADDKKGPAGFAVRNTNGGLENRVPWKSTIYFKRLEPQWQTIYSADKKPVLIRRAWGSGEIVVAGDSYFLSNEALRGDRRPELLSFMVGAPGRVLFDETHLGTEEREGVMVLTNKYRLEGYLYGMLCVVALFLWRNSLPLVPPRSAGASVLGGTVSGKDSRSGLVNLLRRNIPRKELLKTCLAEWKRGTPASRPNLAAKTAEMESVLTVTDPAKPEQILEAYHLLREINAPSRAKGSHATKS